MNSLYRSHSGRQVLAEVEVLLSAPSPASTASMSDGGGKGKIRTWVETNACAVEEGDEREVVQRAVVKVVLLVFACPLTRTLLRLRFACVRRRAQRAEGVQLAEGDALAASVDEKCDFGVWGVGSGRIGAGSEELDAPRPRSGTFLIVADFLAGGGTAKVSTLGLREKSISATISLDCVYSSDSKYSWHFNSIAISAAARHALARVLRAPLDGDLDHRFLELPLAMGATSQKRKDRGNTNQMNNF